MTTTVSLKKQLHELLPALRRFAISLCGNVADADDLLQSTLERLLSKGIPEQVEIMPWAFKVCRNLWLDEHRARQVREKATQQPELQEATSEAVDTQVSDQLELQDINAALHQLPHEQRTIIALVAVQGLSYREAAAIIGVPTGTIMSRLARARSKLAEVMGLATDAFSHQQSGASS
ncbi:RNA polymerase sigma factor [Pseudidiomarina homiensis]|uniref:RNA polymerase subunit sigma-70 n=1 Tax=Pseudidiomarina homiensis TaxID=364198 RepID=A0A432Y6S9_9GAMM|nr:RNA polymerase sigma factor [Pseudidiomarina homiensis]RUO56674.1 RNA polymerase subunit sigma-70 [Pseudidiomarina homiensis]